MKHSNSPLFLGILVVSFSSKGQLNNIKAARTIHEIECPYEFAYEGNPLFRVHAAIDPDVHVWDGVISRLCIRVKSD